MFNYTIDAQNSELKLTVIGRVDNEGISAFQESLDKALERSEEKAVLDLSSLEFINSSGIGKLLIFYKKFKNTGREVQIEGISEDVFTLFKAIRLDKLIEIKR
jgi:anti-sigma B factor antagonist